MHVHVAVQVQHQWYLMVELEELSVIALVCLKMISPGEMEVVPWRGRGENAADEVGKSAKIRNAVARLRKLK